MRWLVPFLITLFLGALFGPDARGPLAAEVLTLRDGLRLVTDQNRLIRIAQADEAISEADTLLARSALLPTVAMSLGETIRAYQPQAIFGTAVVPIQDKNFFAFSVSVQQLVYDFEGSLSRYKASTSLLETKKYDTQRVRNLVALDFVFTYLDILETEKMILVAEREVERLQAHRGVAKSLYEQGVITKNDLLQTEVQLSDARQKLLTTGNLKSVTVSRLNTLLAWPVDRETRVQEVADLTPESALPDKANAWELAVATRPELQIVSKAVESVDLEQKAVRSEYFPRFFVQGSYDFAENSFLVHEDNWGLLFGMTMNLMNGGSTRARVVKLEYQKEQLVEQGRKITEDIKLEVERYYLDVRNATEKIQVTRDAVGQAEENYRINTVRYQEGVGTSTDVIDANTLLRTAEANYTRAQYELKRARAGLLYATGIDLVSAFAE